MISFLTARNAKDQRIQPIRLAFVLKIGLLLCLLPLTIAAVEERPSGDAKIEGLLAQIDRASEKGDFGAVQAMREQLAAYAAKSRNFNVAARQYELLLAARPRRKERVRFFTELGKIRMKLDDYSQAIASFDDALHDNPRDWEANLERARAFAASDLNQRAIESYDRCIRLRPQAGAPYEERGEVYEKQGFLGKALASFQQALAREPRPTIYLHMADCYVHQNDLAKAIEILAQAKTRLPRADYDVRLGEIYQSLGDPARASAAWEEALKSDSTRDDVRLKLALIYDQLHRRADTDRIFGKLLSQYPASPLVHYIRALVLWERGDRPGSLKEARQVEQLSPTELVAHYNALLLAQMRKAT